MGKISKQTGEMYLHGTNNRYLYELQLRKEEGGPNPCKECLQAHRDLLVMQRTVRSQILSRFRSEQPKLYKEWYEELKEKYVARTET